MKQKLIVLAIASIGAASAQPSVIVPAQVTSPRPLEDVANLLSRIYGKVVTYEEPILVWSGDLQPMPGGDGNPNSKWGLLPKPYVLALPSGIGTDPDLTSILQRIIVVNNEQTTGPRYRLLTSKLGYHLIPSQSHDVNGSLVEARSVLDFPIYIPIAARTPTQHIEVFLKAIESASGISVLWSTLGLQRGLDKEFLGHEGSVEWGAAGISGREALTDFFDKSVTSYMWLQKCQVSALPQDRFCVLNVRKIEVLVIDPQGKPATRVLRFDRCADCPPLDSPLPSVKGDR